MHKYDSELRKKMQSMESVPTGFRFDAAASWKKMEGQLQAPTGKRRSFVWMYWAAASLVLVIGCLIMLDSNNKQAAGSLVKLPLREIQQNTMPMTGKGPVNKDVRVALMDNRHHPEHTAGKKRIEKPSTIIMGQQETFPDSIKQQEPVIAVQPNSNVEWASVATNNNMAAAPKTATVQKKPKLKVVHINELDAPPPPITARLDTKKQLPEQDIMDDASGTNKPFWQKKPKQANTAFTDNQ